MATDTAQAERPNKVTVSDAGPCLKKVAIEIPAETVTEQLGTSMDTLLVEAELPGFRKGRAPRRLVEKRFGTAVRKEAKEQLVAQAYSKAVEEHKLRVIGNPSGGDLEKIEVESGKPLKFELEVEVPPQFELPSFDSIAVKRPMSEITDAMIEEQIDRIALQEGRLESQEKPAAGDYLTGHGKVATTKDGKVHIDIQDAVIQIPMSDKGGKGMILGIRVDDFADQLGLPGIGKTATIKVKGPAGHELEDLRDADLKIEFTVARIDRIVPAPIDELVGKFGFADAAALRESIKGRMQERVAIEQAAAMREQAADQIIDSVKMELPERLTRAQTERNLARKQMELVYRGVDRQQIEEDLADLRAASSEVAQREMKLFFILDKAAESLDVRVGEAEINARITQMALANNQRPDQLRAELIRRNQISSVYQQILEHKTLDAIIGKAKVTEVPSEEYAKEVAAAKEKAAPVKKTKKK